MAGAVRDILRLQFIFGGLDAPTLAPPQPEVIAETVAITRLLEVRCAIARSTQETVMAVELQLETVAIARATQESISVARSQEETNSVFRIPQETVSIQQLKQEEFER